MRFIFPYFLIKNVLVLYHNPILLSIFELSLCRIASIYERTLLHPYPASPNMNLVFGEELSRIIHFVVDGMDQENIEDICFKRYYSWSYSGLEGFLYLLYFDVALEIQAGVSHQCMEEGIRSLMPDEVNKEIDKFLTEKDGRISYIYLSDRSHIFHIFQKHNGNPFRNVIMNLF